MVMTTTITFQTIVFHIIITTIHCNIHHPTGHNHNSQLTHWSHINQENQLNLINQDCHVINQLKLTIQIIIITESHEIFNYRIPFDFHIQNSMGIPIFLNIIFLRNIFLNIVSQVIITTKMLLTFENNKF